jgi:hypothetical protein
MKNDKISDIMNFVAYFPTRKMNLEMPANTLSEVWGACAIEDLGRRTSVSILTESFRAAFIFVDLVSSPVVLEVYDESDKLVEFLDDEDEVMARYYQLFKDCESVIIGCLIANNLPLPSFIHREK